MSQDRRLAPVDAEARAALSAGIEAELEGLRRFSLGKRLLELAVFVPMWPAGAAITLSAYHLLEPGWLCYALMAVGILLSAVALNAYVLLLHEGMHHVLFANPALNRWVSVLLGIPALISFTAYQVMHLRHHHFLGDPRDPDEYSNYTGSRWRLWTMHFTRLLVGAFLYLILIPLSALRRGNPEQRRRIGVEYLILVPCFVAALLLVPAADLLLGWFVPAVLVAYFTNIRGFTQHGITDHHDPYLASRSMRPNPAVAFCLLNENYHLEHHLFPEVPSYHLAEVHRLIWPRLPRAVTGTSYIAFLCRFLRATLTLDMTPIGLVHPAEEKMSVTAAGPPVPSSQGPPGGSR
jgi:fatty acid desaturase